MKDERARDLIRLTVETGVIFKADEEEGNNPEIPLIMSCKIIKRAVPREKDGRMAVRFDQKSQALPPQRSPFYFERKRNALLCRTLHSYRSISGAAYDETALSAAFLKCINASRTNQGTNNICDATAIERRGCRYGSSGKNVMRRARPPSARFGTADANRYE